MFRTLYFSLIALFAVTFCISCQNNAPSKEEAKMDNSVATTQNTKEKDMATVNTKEAAPAKTALASNPIAESKEEKSKEVIQKTASESVTKVESTKEEQPKVVEKPKKKKKRSKIKFAGTTHEFGTIKTGDKVNHKFKFKNTGNAPLTIKNVDVSCGCTFPSYPFIPIEPGEEGEIDVTFDSKNKLGRQKPTITVITNGRPRTIKLYMEGYVE